MNTAIESGQWVVLSRPECSLCESFLEDLSVLLGTKFEHIKLIDISNDEDLERKYGSRIPVLLIEDEFVCAYRLDKARVQPYL
jgi:hypothetical protein